MGSSGERHLVLNRLPIRWKMALLIGGCGLALTVALVPIETQRARQAAERSIDDSLREELGEAIGIAGNGLSVTGLGDAHATSATQFVYLLLDAAGQVEDSSEHSVTAALTRNDGSPITGATGIVDAVGPSGARLRAASVTLGIDDSTKTLVVAADTAVVGAAGADATRRWIIDGLLASVLIALGAYVITGLVLRPVERIRRSALRVATGEAAAQIEIPVPNDELRRLALAFDQTVRELQRSVSVRDRFIAEASHELRTPITRLRTELDLALIRPRSRDELTQALSDASRHAAQLTRLVDQLLDLTRLRADQHVDGGPVSVDDILDDAIGCESDVVWTPSGAWTWGDHSMLVRAVQNLVENAIIHGGSPVTVKVSLLDDVSIEIVDCGEGFDIDHAFTATTPFTRSRSARGRVGAGLGLAIVGEIARRHGGRFELARFVDRTVATLHLPAWSPTEA